MPRDHKVQKHNLRHSQSKFCKILSRKTQKVIVAVVVVVAVEVVVVWVVVLVVVFVVTVNNKHIVVRLSDHNIHQNLEALALQNIFRNKIYHNLPHKHEHHYYLKSFAVLLQVVHVVAIARKLYTEVRLSDHNIHLNQEDLFRRIFHNKTSQSHLCKLDAHYNL